MGNILNQVMGIKEAAERWSIPHDTLKSRIKKLSDDLPTYTTYIDRGFVKRTNKTWLLTTDLMLEWYGTEPSFEDYTHLIQRYDCDVEDIIYRTATSLRFNHQEDKVGLDGQLLSFVHVDTSEINTSMHLYAIYLQPIVGLNDIDVRTMNADDLSDAVWCDFDKDFDGGAYIFAHHDLAVMEAKLADYPALDTQEIISRFLQAFAITDTTETE